MKANTSIFTACSKKEILCSDLLDLPFPRPIQPRCYVVDPIECGREKHLHCTLFTATNEFQRNSAVEICCDGLGIQGLGRDLGMLGSYMYKLITLFAHV